MQAKEYLRDGRAPVPKSPVTSRVMSANKAKDTKPEILFRKALKRKGVFGFKTNWRGAPGRPDIAFPKQKVAIFVHGCFWHRCPICRKKLPKSNTVFWKEKFQKNKLRDRKKVKLLERDGWRVLVFWECQVLSSVDTLAAQTRASI